MEAINQQPTINQFYVNPPKQEYQTGGSYFSSVDNLIGLIDYMKNSFVSNIENRKKYLKRLINIGDNWISGESISPSKNSISLSTDILEFYKNKFLEGNINNDIQNSLTYSPQILLSPIPSGGIYIEFKVKDYTSLSISINNDAEISFELEEKGFYSDKEGVTKETVFNELTQFFNANGYSTHSRRRSFI